MEKLTPSERQALRFVRQNEGCTQARLSASLHIAQQSVSRIVGTLAERRLLNVGDTVSGGQRGKPTPTLRLRAEACYAAGISIMADSVATGVIDFSGSLLGREVAYLPGMAQEDVLIEIDRQLTALMEKRVLNRSDLVGAGVAMTGYFMGRERKFNPPSALRHWIDVDIQAAISERLGLPVWADNDGNAAAVGEAALGVGRRFRNFAYLYFSTGFGGGVIVDGKLLEGRFGNSGEFAGILPHNIYAHPNLELLRHCVAQAGTELGSVHELVTHFDPEWSGINEWISKVKESLTLVVSACSAILDTEAIVLGGLMPRALAERVIPELEFYSTPRWGVRRPIPDLLPAEAPGEATLFGAASMPLERIYF